MKCMYCGEEEATDRLGDPNLDMSKDIDWSNEKNWWKVCKDCKQVIPLQMMSGIDDEKLQGYCNKKLQEIAEKTGKPIMTARISKKEDGTLETSSVEFTGKKDS